MHVPIRGQENEEALQGAGKGSRHSRADRGLREVDVSHDATNWAIKQRGLKPATKIVLWHLADCHNGHTGQCNPRQDTLAEMCEMSRSTLNVHLGRLEDLGLIKRIVSIDKSTKRQRATHYVLAMDTTLKAVSGNRTQAQDVGSEAQGVVVPSPETGHGAVSGNQQEPCPDFNHSRVRNPDTMNLGKEPGREPCAGEVSDPDFGFAQFWDAFPDPVERDAARKAFDAVLAAEKIGPPGLIAAAKSYAGSDQVQRGFGMKPANWLIRGAWRDQAPPATSGPVVMSQAGADLDAIARHWAPVVKAGRSFAASAIRPAVARHMMALDLVTADELRGVGVSL